MGCKLSVNLFRGERRNGSVEGYREEGRTTKSATGAGATVGAVLLIQRSFRRYRARREARRQLAWRVHQVVEYSAEQGQLMMHKLLSLSPKHRPPSSPETDEYPGSYSETEIPDSKLQINWEAVDQLDSKYKGLRIKYPITTETVKNLLAFFRSGNNKLSNRDILQLILHTQSVLRAQTNLHEISCDSITICGDLHGNFDDLLTIFQKNCLPSISNPYLFNGDFVDRGSKSIEVLVVLFSCVIQNSKAVYLNRGNHEDYFMNERYGFYKEIRIKYPEICDNLIKLFRETFGLLPLGSLLNSSILVIHGGISVDTDLSIIKALRRDKFSSAINFESDNMDEREIGEWKQVLNLLWSDPRPTNGCKMNTFRGGGCYFGPDVTTNFLRQHRLKLLVRSHECKMNGWEYCHDDKVLTLFSASNYYELGSNYGAFAIINKAGNVTVTQYKGQDALNFRKKEEESVSCLMSEIWQRRHFLMNTFKQHDPHQTGKKRGWRSVTVVFDVVVRGSISTGQWVAVMTKVMNMDLPWRQLKQYLIPDRTHSNEVPYREMITHLENQQQNNNSSGSEFSGSNFGTNIELMFHLFDRKNLGRFDFVDFRNCFEESNYFKNKLQEEELEKLWTTFDLNKDGWIDKTEFYNLAKHIECI